MVVVSKVTKRAEKLLFLARSNSESVMSWDLGLRFRLIEDLGLEWNEQTDQ